MPGLYTLSGGVWIYPYYEFYTESPGPCSWSLAWKFFAISCLASVVALADAWIFTRGIRGKWRMRFAVCIFITILCGWSYASLKAKSGVIEGLEFEIKNERIMWRRAIDRYVPSDGDWEMNYYRRRAEELEKALQDFKNQETDMEKK